MIWIGLRLGLALKNINYAFNFCNRDETTCSQLENGYSTFTSLQQ